MDESGLNIPPHRGIVHHVVRCLHEGQMVVVLADQRGDDARPVWVDYFGKRVLANGVFAKFAAEGAVYVFPIFALRTSDGRYRRVYEVRYPSRGQLTKKTI
jgi:lauroyl/myristoyl acyltransferase